jgi:hypothetical protein
VNASSRVGPFETRAETDTQFLPQAEYTLLIRRPSVGLHGSLTLNLLDEINDDAQRNFTILSVDFYSAASLAGVKPDPAQAGALFPIKWKLMP